MKVWLPHASIALNVVNEYPQSKFDLAKVKKDLQHGGPLGLAAAAAREFKQSIQQFIEEKKLGGEVKIVVFIFMDWPCYQKEYQGINVQDFLAGFNGTDHFFHLILTSEGGPSAKVQGKFPLLCICVLTLRLIRCFPKKCLRFIWATSAANTLCLEAPSHSIMNATRFGGNTTTAMSVTSIASHSLGSQQIVRSCQLIGGVTLIAKTSSRFLP